MSTMKAVRVMVKVRRNPMEVTPQVVFAHEFKLLAEKHGEGNVELLEELPEGVDPRMFEGTHDIDVNDEWNRLQTVYGNHPEMNMPLVEYVFRNDKDELAAAGVKKKGSGKADAGGNGKLKKAEIVAKLDELEVEYKPSAKRPELLELLHTSLQDRLEDLEIEFDEGDAVEVLIKALEDAEA